MYRASPPRFILEQLLIAQCLSGIRAKNILERKQRCHIADFLFIYFLSCVKSMAWLSGCLNINQYVRASRLWFKRSLSICISTPGLPPYGYCAVGLRLWKQFRPQNYVAVRQMPQSIFSVLDWQTLCDF